MFEWYYMLVESDRRATWLFCGECQIAKEIVPWQNLNLKPKIFTRCACFQLFNLPWWQIEVNKAFLGEILPLVKCLQTSNWRKGAQELTLNCKVLKDNFGKMTKLKNDRKCLPSELLNTVFSNPIVAYIWPFIQHKRQEIKARNFWFALKPVMWSDVLIRSYESVILCISWLLLGVKYQWTDLI